MYLSLLDSCSSSDATEAHAAAVSASAAQPEDQDQVQRNSRAGDTSFEQRVSPADRQERGASQHTDQSDGMQRAVTSLPPPSAARANTLTEQPRQVPAAHHDELSHAEQPDSKASSVQGNVAKDPHSIPGENSSSNLLVETLSRVISACFLPSSARVCKKSFSTLELNGAYFMCTTSLPME